MRFEQVGACTGGLDRVPDNIRQGRLDHLPQMFRRLGQQGYTVSRKRVRRLIRLMGLRSVMPRPYASRSTPGHIVYTYLLADVKVTWHKKIWCVDGARLPLRGRNQGWHSRKVLTWWLFNR